MAIRLAWVNQLDVGIQQELPGFFKGHKSVVRLDIHNLLNLLNKDWGVTKTIGWLRQPLPGTPGQCHLPTAGYVYELGIADQPVVAEPTAV